MAPIDSASFSVLAAIQFIGTVGTLEFLDAIPSSNCSSVQHRFSSICGLDDPVDFLPLSSASGTGQNMAPIDSASFSVLAAIQFIGAVGTLEFLDAIPSSNCSSVQHRFSSICGLDDPVDFLPLSSASGTGKNMAPIDSASFSVLAAIQFIGAVGTLELIDAISSSNSASLELKFSPVWWLDDLAANATVSGTDGGSSACWGVFSLTLISFV